MKTAIKTFSAFGTTGKRGWGYDITIHIVSRAVSSAGRTCIFMLTAPEGTAKMTCASVPHHEKEAGFQDVLKAALADIPPELHQSIRLKAALTSPLRPVFREAMKNMRYATKIEAIPSPTPDDAPSLGVLVKVKNKRDLTDGLFRQVFEDLEQVFYPGGPDEQPADEASTPADALLKAVTDQEPPAEAPADREGPAPLMLPGGQGETLSDPPEREWFPGVVYLACCLALIVFGLMLF